MVKSVISLLILIIAFATPSYGAGGSIYADMERGPDGRFKITAITNKEGDVDLKDLAPVGYNLKKWDCSHAFWGRYRISNRACAPADAEFRTSRQRLWPTLLFGLTTAGISLALGIVKEESVFDRAAYDRAVHEALTISGLDEKREAIVGKYILIRETVNKHSIEMKGLYRQYTDEYYSKSPKRAINKKIIDRSGYYREDDLLKDVLIKVSLKQISPAEQESYAPEEFSVAPSGIEDQLEAMEAFIKDNFARNKAEYAARLRKETSEFDVVCGPELMPPYHIKYECPQTVPIESPEFPEATAIVVSKDFRNVFPHYVEEDEFLRVTLARNTITIENKSGKTVRIVSATMLYNDKRSVTYTGEDLRTGIKPLEPRAVSESAVPFRRLINNDVAREAEFREMTREKAKKAGISFAIEVKYKVGEEGSERTLYQRKSYGLEELIG